MDAFLGTFIIVCDSHNPLLGERNSKTHMIPAVQKGFSPSYCTHIENLHMQNLQWKLAAERYVSSEKVSRIAIIVNHKVRL